MAWRVCLAAGLSSALLSGCASVGNESIADATPQTVSAQLIKGRTNQRQVREIYGDPAKTSFTDSGVFFDKSKVVQQYTISSSKVDVSSGLITR